MFSILIFAFILLIAPAWTACCIVPRLAWLTNPVLRADLAVTPQDAAAFLRAKLKSRIILSYLPGILSLAVPMIVWVTAEWTHSLVQVQGFVASTRTVIILGAMAALVPLLQSAIVCAAVLTMARRACIQMRALNPWTSGALAIVIASGTIIAWSIALTFLLRLFASDPYTLSKLFYVPYILFSFPLCMFVGTVAFRKWRSFVSVYFEIDSAKMTPPKTLK